MFPQLCVLVLAIFAARQAAAHPQGVKLTFLETKADNCIDTSYNECNYDDFWYQSYLTCPAKDPEGGLVGTPTLSNAICDWSIDYWLNWYDDFSVGGNSNVEQVGTVTVNCRVPCSCYEGAADEWLTLIGRGNLYEVDGYITSLDDPNIEGSCLPHYAGRVPVPANSTSAFDQNIVDAWHPGNLEKRASQLARRTGVRLGKKLDVLGGEDVLYDRPLLKKVEVAKNHQDALTTSASKAGNQASAAADKNSAAATSRREYYRDGGASKTYYPAYVDVGSGTFTVTSASGKTEYDRGTFQMVFDYCDYGESTPGPVSGNVFTPYQLDLWLTEGGHKGYYHEGKDYHSGDHHSGDDGAYMPGY